MSGCLRPLVRGLGVMDRLNAARGRFVTGPDTRLIWLVVAVVALAVAAGTLAWLIHRRLKRADLAARAALDREAAPVGLSEEEYKLLNSLAELGGLERPSTVYTMQSAFDHGIAGLIESGHTDEMSEETRSKTFQLLELLRDKLGFGKSARAEINTPRSTRQIPQGTKLLIMKRHGSGSFTATVTSADSDQLEVQPETPVQCTPGELRQVRYSDGARVWRFDAPILSNDGTKIALGHSEHVHLHNRRRFPRIPLLKPAHLTKLPFVKRPRAEELPKFQSASLVEISGPGLKLESQVRPRRDDRLLLAFRLHNKKVVEAVAQVRRLLPDREDKAVFVVELIGLSREELAELARETNIAARKNLAEYASPKAKDWKAASTQETSDVRPN